MTREEFSEYRLDENVLEVNTRVIDFSVRHNGQICVFDNGDNSGAVLLHIVRKIYPDIQSKQKEKRAIVGGGEIFDPLSAWTDYDFAAYMRHENLTFVNYGQLDLFEGATI